MHKAEIEQVRQALQALQDGYTSRDKALLDQIMDLFFDSPDLEILGTNGIRPGLDEWYLGLAGARELVRGDWEGWGDVRLDVAGASIHVLGEAAWLATTGTVTTTIPAEENYASYLRFVREYLEQDGQTAEQKLLYILRGGTNTLYELRRGETFVWSLRLTAVLVKGEAGWKFHQMHFSFPTIYFPDVRITE